MRNYKGKNLFVGIDVHKNSYSISVICEGTLIKRDRIIAYPSVLLMYLQKFQGARIFSAYEAGFCGFYLHRFLIKHGIENIVVNPSSIEINSRDVVKTDKRDSLKIAKQLEVGRLTCIYIPSENREDKRLLTRLRKNLTRKRARASNNIKSLLHLFGLIPPNSNKRVSTKFINELLEQSLPKNLRFSILTLFDEWRYLSIQIKKVTLQIELEMQEDKKLEDICQSVPGVGPTSAHILINELEDMSQFSNEQKLFSYAGLTPREYSSGDHKRQGHISRQGKPIIRSTLVESSWKAIQIDPELNEKFEKIKQRKGSKIAIVAIARILLGRIRSCLLENRSYYSKPIEKIKHEEKIKTKNIKLKNVAM